MASPAGGGISGRGGSGVNSAVRGAGLVGLAVVLGIVLLQVIDKGPAGNGATPARTSHATTPTTAPTPTSASAPASSQPATTKAGNAKPRAEVRVLVFNAGAASGAAGNMTNKLRSLGYQLASVIAGGPAPIIGLYLWTGKYELFGASFASPFPTKTPFTIRAYILICCVIGFLATLALKNRQAFDHTKEYEEQGEMVAAGERRPAMG